MIGQLLLSIILKKARLFAGPSCKHIHLLMGILGICKIPINIWLILCS